MKFFRDLILTALATTVVILLVEGGLRLAQVRCEASLYEPEQERGYSLRPNAAGWSTGESEVYIRINSDGMRDRERPIARPRQTLRVAIIGASEAVAAEVPLNKTYKSVLNDDLSGTLGAGGQHADVLSFGVGGYTLSQEYLTLHNHVWKYQPQVVVLLLSPFSIMKATRQFYPGELKGAPVWLLRNGELVPDEITQHAPPINERTLHWKNLTSDWMNQSYFLSILNMARVKAGEMAAGIRIQPRKAVASSEPPERWRYDPNQPEVQECWAITEAFFQKMKDDCARHGAEFWIAPVEMSIQVHPVASERLAFQQRLGLETLDGVDSRLQQFGAAHGIPVINLSKPLGEYAAAHQVYLHGAPAAATNVGHWNELGNELAGHVIARELLARSSAVRHAIEEHLH